MSSILDLESKEQKENTHKMLREHYQKCREEQSLSEDILSDQLYDLLQVLEEQDNDHPITHSQVLALMPPALRADFQRDLDEGRLQEMVLEKWYPWWRPQLGTAGNDDEEEEDRATFSGTLIRTSLMPTKITTFDERLMKIPKFTTICRKPQPFPVLLYSLIDILYAFCWTMRLYHGIPNVLAVHPGSATKNTPSGGEDDVAVDAAATLMQASATLGKDARYLSMEQVLISSTSESTRAYPDGCNAEWRSLVEDCALIVASHTLVGRALLETSDLFKAAIRCLKQDNENVTSSSIHNETISKLRHLRKKLEFFLSWSQHAKSEFGSTIKDEMMQWRHHWNSGHVAADQLSDVFDDLLCQDPVLNMVSIDRSPKSPLIVEMSSM